jgi:hypothetical protein
MKVRYVVTYKWAEGKGDWITKRWHWSKVFYVKQVADDFATLLESKGNYKVLGITENECSTLIEIGTGDYSDHDTEGLIKLGRHDVSWRNTTDTDFFCLPECEDEARAELAVKVKQASENQRHYYSKQYV